MEIKPGQWEINPITNDVSQIVNISVAELIREF